MVRQAHPASRIAGCSAARSAVPVVSALRHRPRLREDPGQRGAPGSRPSGYSTTRLVPGHGAAPPSAVGPVE